MNKAIFQLEDYRDGFLKVVWWDPRAGNFGAITLLHKLPVVRLDHEGQTMPRIDLLSGDILCSEKAIYIFQMMQAQACENAERVLRHRKKKGVQVDECRKTGTNGR